jgi:hypothetical protein
MASILNEIIQWSNTFPFWEQVALDKIVTGVTFTEADYND